MLIRCHAMPAPLRTSTPFTRMIPTSSQAKKTGALLNLAGKLEIDSKITCTAILRLRFVPVPERWLLRNSGSNGGIAAEQIPAAMKIVRTKFICNNMSSPLSSVVRPEPLLADRRERLPEQNLLRYIILNHRRPVIQICEMISAAFFPIFSIGMETDARGGVRYSRKRLLFQPITEISSGTFTPRSVNTRNTWQATRSSEPITREKSFSRPANAFSTEPNERSAAVMTSHPVTIPASLPRRKIREPVHPDRCSRNEK